MPLRGMMLAFDAVFAAFLGQLDHASALQDAFEPAVAALALEFAGVFAVKVGDVPAAKAAFVQLHDLGYLAGGSFAMADL
jgi:hypothetical protein